jgi:hypothetical protein
MGLSITTMLGMIESFMVRHRILVCRQ